MAAPNTFSGNTAPSRPRAPSTDLQPPSFLSQNASFGARPMMRAREAAGLRTDNGLEDLVSFLRDTAPEPRQEETRASRQSLSSKTSSRFSQQGNLVMRVLRASKAKPSQQQSRSATANTVEKFTSSGHKYLQITPAVLESKDGARDSEPRQTSGAPAESTLVVADAPAPSFEANVMPPRSATAIKSIISRFESDPLKLEQKAPLMSKGKPVLRHFKTEDDLKPSQSDGDMKSKRRKHTRPTPPDSEISAIIRNTPQTFTSLRTRAKDISRTPSPSQPFGSHPIEPPSPAPLYPLPAPPNLHQQDAEVSSDKALSIDALPQASAELRSQRATPSERSIPPSLLAMSAESEVATRPAGSSNDDPFTSQKTHSLEGTAEESVTALQMPANPILSSPVTTGRSLSLNSSAAHHVDTPNSREERTRLRKLRHLKTSRPQPPLTPQSTPPNGGTEFSDAKPSTVSKGLTEFSMSGIITIINQPPVAMEVRTPAFGPLRPLSTVTGHRLSSSFPYNDPAYSVPPRPATAGSMQEQQKRLSSMRSTSSRPLTMLQSPPRFEHADRIVGALPVPIFPARSSYLSQSDENKTTNANDRSFSMTSQSSAGCGNLDKRSSYQSRNGSNAGMRPSRADLRTQILQLERQVNLLDAALIAVLQTGGMLNGCPCQADKLTSTSDISLKEVFAFLSGPARESILSQVAIAAQARVQLAESSTTSPETNGNKGSKRISANTGVSRESSGRLAAPKKESNALALYMATRIDPAVQRSNSLESMNEIAEDGNVASNLAADPSVSMENGMP